MRIGTRIPEFERKSFKLAAWFGVFAFLFCIVIAVTILSNRLLVDTRLSVLSSKIKAHVIGNNDTSVSSLEDVYTYLQGAFMGLVNPPKLPDVSLQVSQSEILKLVGSFNKDERKWVGAELSLNNSQSLLRGKIRAKGDRELHAESVSSMSFRVKLKGENRLFGMKKFSIQKPLLRGYTWELLIADVFKRNGLATLKSIPINFKVNGDDRGIYILEEVPSTRMLEKNQRKDGPIFGLDENFGTLISSKLDVYNVKKWKDNSLYILKKST